MFERGQAEGEEDTFNNVFKKDFIEATSMKARRKLNRMKINPYPNAVLRCGLRRKELRENADPILEEAMMYSAMVGTEMLSGMVEEWKGEVTEHMWDIGEAQGGIQGWLLEAEARLTQAQAIIVGMSREIEMLGDVVQRQSELLGVHRGLILELDQENQRRFERIERMLDLRGRTFGNPILINLDLEEGDVDEVTLVE